MPLAALAFASVLVGVAHAASELQDRLFPGRVAAAPPVARYVVEDGQGFVFDRSAPRPLLKFDGHPEIWVLDGQPGPRGDMIYRNDAGALVLRATRVGGVIVYGPGQPQGAAASLAGGTQPLRVQPMNLNALFQRLTQASVKATRAAKHLISFEAEGVTPDGSGLVADAANLAAEALGRMMSRAEGRSAVAPIRSVVLIEGKAPSCVVQRGVLRITVNPDAGYAGRPSSERMIAAVMRGA